VKGPQFIDNPGVRYGPMPASFDAVLPFPFQTYPKGEYPMPLKLNCGVCRKIGEADYGSRGASVNIELEVEADLVNSPQRLHDRIRQLFRLAKASVEEELTGTDRRGGRR